MSNFAIGVVEPISAVTNFTGFGSSEAGTNLNYLTNGEPGLIWRRGVSTTSNYGLDVDLGSAKPIGIFSIFGLLDVLTGLPPANLNLRWQSSSDGVNFGGVGNYDSGEVDLLLSSNRTSSYGKSLVTAPTRPVYRYWRMLITTGGASTQLEMARVALCDIFQPLDNVEWGLKFEFDDTSKMDVSETGYDEVEEQRILPLMSGVIPWGQISEEARMRQLVYRAGNSREVVASLNPEDSDWGEDTTLWGRFRPGLALTLADYDVNTLDFTVRAIMP